ncbi:MAG: helix-turn-helix domain-containing protein [Flavobacterium sp.]|nr:helix-turn-helix domain-containing protein [Flavobacterium sp.]
MIFNPSRNHKTNIYFIVILILVGVQRFIYALEILGFVQDTYSPLKKNLRLGFYIVPVYYLFFKRLIQGFDKLKKELLHFIFPTVFILINLVFFNSGINRLFFLIYSSVYFILILIMLKDFINRKNTSMLQKKSYREIKTWLLLMITLTFVLITYSNYFLFSGSSSQMTLDTFYKYSSLIWLLVLIYMFKNPIVIFGEHYLLKNIELNEPPEFLVWSRKRLKTIEEKDKIVYNTILKRIDFIISDIQILQKSDEMLSTTTFTADTLAKQLKIPRRHLEFVFKYYCHYSINDFSNLVKVNYAVSLINKGYLDSYTVESLGEKCLFNSRFTFSKNFKKFIGVSVSDFVNSTVKSKLFFGENLSL